MTLLRGSIARATHRTSTILFFLLLSLFATTPVRAVKVSTSIEGIHDAMLDNVKISLTIAAEAKNKKLSPVEIRAMHARAPDEIRRALEPFGYYDPRIDANLEEKKNGDFQARYRIVPGPPTRLRSVHVGVVGPGSKSAPFPGIVAAFPLRPGDVADQRPYTQTKVDLATAAADSGYLDARFKRSEILVDREHHSAAMDLVFDTGPRYRFGPVEFDSTVVNERVLRAYVTFKTGEPFRYDRLLALQSGLGGAPYLGRVEVVPRKDLAQNLEVPIQVHLSPRAPRRYELGGGYGTDTGARVRFDAQFRRLNTAGHQFHGRINVSEIDLSVFTDYVIPARYPRRHSYTIGAEVSKLDPVAYTTQREAVGATRLQPRLGWNESFHISYEREDFTVGSDKGVTDLLIASLNYQRKRADDIINPTSGYRIDLGVRGASDQIASTQTFVSFTASGRTIQTRGRVALLARVDTGRTLTPVFRELPPTIRFFAGGDNSVRGYDYQSLGPRDADGHVIGSEYLLVGSVETQLRIVGKWSLSGFVDARNAFERSDHGHFDTGVGFGVNWGSPVGPIGADLAFPVHHEGWKIHIVMGPYL